MVMAKQSGFTLIELVTTVAIIAILAAIALPSYENQMRKSRRSDAVRALGELQLRQERFRASNPSFGTLANIGGMSDTSYYTFAVTANSATGYTLTADPIGVQAADVACDPLTLTVAGNVVTKTPANCW
jgi:type IV pilus assembly protein PilE